MGKGMRDGNKTKRAPTQSAERKKKAMMRSRKQAKKKQTMKKGSWVQSIKSRYERAKAEEDAEAEEKDELYSKHKRVRGKDTGFLGEDGKGGVQVEDEVDEEKQERMNKASPLETQLFLKGCPSDVTEDQLRHFFVQFGNVKKCFIVKNAMTKIATGSAFIHFKTVAEADAAYSHAQQNAREVATAARTDFAAKTQGLSHHQAKRMAYKKKGGIGGPEGKDGKDPFITINDSRIIVHRVLSRTDSQEATASMTKKKKRTRVAADDPRNLYLLQEGMIFKDSPAAGGLSDRYLQQLEDDYNTRKQNLKDINHYVSKVRLSFRNIPKAVDNAAFRKLVLAEARGYFKDHPEDVDKDNWGKHGPIKNIKIVLDQDGQSRGFGFCELASHGAALHVLRRLNNNPNTYGPNRRLIVSFAVENVNAVQKLQHIREIRRTKRNRDGDAAGGQAEAAEGEDHYSGN